jgi:hypothetical protein
MTGYCIRAPYPDGSERLLYAAVLGGEIRGWEKRRTDDGDVNPGELHHKWEHGEVRNG